MDEQKYELRNLVLRGTVQIFHRKGIKIAMDDVASDNSTRKTAIYTVFPDKESLFLDMVDFMFDGIKESEEAVCADEALSTLEKIRKILGVMPESYRNIDFRQLYTLKSKYPIIYSRVEERLETGWEKTIALLEQGIREGVVKQIPIVLVKTMLEATIEQFFQRDVLIRNEISYVDALQQIVNIIVDGIAV